MRLLDILDDGTLCPPWLRKQQGLSEVCREERSGASEERKLAGYVPPYEHRGIAMYRALSQPLMRFR